MELAVLAGILFWGLTVVVSTLAWLTYQERHEEKAYWLDDTEPLRAFFLVLILTFLMPLYTAVVLCSIPIHDFMVRWEFSLIFLSILFSLYLGAFLKYAWLGLPRVPRRKILLPFAVLVLLLPLVALASTGLGSLVYLSLPKTEIKSPMESYEFERDWSQAISELKYEAPSLLAGKPESEIERMVAAKYPILKRHYDVLTDDRGIFVRIYEPAPLKLEKFVRDIHISQTPQPAASPAPPADQGGPQK
jgi:hypothetical protein